MDIDRDKDIDYIARHYHKGLFNTSSALRRVRTKPGLRWTGAKTIAASALIAVVGATAAVIIRNNYLATSPEVVEQSQAIPIAPETISRTIDFEDIPLPVVTEKIKEVYGVEVTGLPDNAESYRLSLHYEGTAIDLIETINDILDTDMRINSYTD